MLHLLVLVIGASASILPRATTINVVQGNDDGWAEANVRLMYSTLSTTPGFTVNLSLNSIQLLLTASPIHRVSSHPLRSIGVEVGALTSQPYQPSLAGNMGLLPRVHLLQAQTQVTVRYRIRIINIDLTGAPQ